MTRWTTVNKAAERLGISRWDVLMRCLHKQLNYRPTTNGIEVSEQSIRNAERRATVNDGIVRTAG